MWWRTRATLPSLKLRSEIVMSRPMLDPLVLAGVWDESFETPYTSCMAASIHIFETTGDSRTSRSSSKEKGSCHTSRRLEVQRGSHCRFLETPDTGRHATFLVPTGL